MKRFEALDSWRGIAACMVALFHFHATSHISHIPFLHNGYLFVDFFFVLSGFVIAANYQDRLLGDFGIWRFMWLRLGRLYPLHITMLLVFILRRVVQDNVPALQALATTVAFHTPQEAPATIVANLLLVHSLNLFDFLTWNGPSWSISAEFYSYFIFAGLLVTLRQRMWLALALAVVLGPIAIAILKGHMNTYYDYALVRCLAGFSAGVIVWNIYRVRKPIFSTSTEIIAALAALAFVSIAGETPVSVLAPYIFAVVVYVFAAEGGAVSRALRWRPCLLLGLLSYSIYMVHSFIRIAFYDSAKVVGKLAGHTFLMRDRPDLYLAVNTWTGDLLYVAYLIVVVCVSYLTYRLIEAPGREWFRRMTDHRALIASQSEPN